MELILIASNGTILALLYQKLLHYEGILVDMRSRISSLEEVAVERRKKGDRRFTPLVRDANIDGSL